MGSHLSLAVKPQFFKGTSRQSHLLGFGLRHTVRPVLNVWASLPHVILPLNFLDHIARLLPVHEGTMWRSVDLKDCRAEWLQAKGVDDIHAGNEKAILYFHGGGFLTCGLNTHRRLVSRVSFASQQPVLNVDYRQMPHQPIINTIADCVDGFRWLVGQGYKPENITLAGDSAGGYLAFAVARAVLDSGWGRPAGVVAMSPILDLDPAGKANHRNAHICQTFPLKAIARLTEVAARVEARHGVTGLRVDPVNMHMTNFPPSLIVIGSREILMADAELMANRLVSAGVPCDLQVWDRQVHVFQAAAAWIPEGRAAIEEIGKFIAGLEGQETVETVAPVAGAVRSRRVRSQGVSGVV
ncbi:MAG: alpha/beta hydrolase fold domain-containing protein [Aeromicrobium sp.]